MEACAVSIASRASVIDPVRFLIELLEFAESDVFRVKLMTCVELLPSQSGGRW